MQCIPLSKILPYWLEVSDGTGSHVGVVPSVYVGCRFSVRVVMRLVLTGVRYLLIVIIELKRLATVAQYMVVSVSSLMMDLTISC